MNYTSEKNTLIMISLLKAHGIKKVIVSPGTTNISFVASIQTDNFFEIYSAVDERSAAYMACGLAEESEEPVVLSCTGATASRNYIPGLTEAFYRHLPILAVTSSQHIGRVGNYVAQMLDRSEQFNDCIKKSICLPTIFSLEDEQTEITMINDAILELNHNISGPVHINLVTTYSNDFSIKNLPTYRVIKRITKDNFPDLPKGPIGIFVGAHCKFNKEETDAIDNFCCKNNAIVICDQISNYRGKYRFLASLSNNQNVDLGTRKFSLIIYIGYIHGTYINFSSKELWRVNRDGIIRDPYKNITYVFEMSEIDFFKYYSKESADDNDSLLISFKNVQKKLLSKLPELPFSNIWIAKETASLIPNNSVLHLSILNSLRAWNYFETNDNVLCYSNSGGFGIDGCLSSFIGSAITNQKIPHFIIIGDLSFFYDVNTLLNEIPNNVHIMLINNGIGTEFKNYNHRAAYFGEQANKFIAAKGHNGFKNEKLIKDLCEHFDFDYISAKNKDEYLNNRDIWLNYSSKPIIFEIFTTDKNESDALKLINNIEKDKSIKGFIRRSLVGKILKKIKKGIKK